jgi:hypothetical protein
MLAVEKRRLLNVATGLTATRQAGRLPLPMEETKTPKPNAGEDGWEKLKEYISDVTPIPGDELP